MEYSKHTQSASMELQIISDKDNKYIKYPEIKKIIIDTQNQCAKALTKVAREYYLWEIRKYEHYKETGLSLEDKKVFGKTIDSQIEDYAKYILSYMHTSNVSALRQRQAGALKTKNKKGNKKEGNKLDKILNYESQLSTFTNTNPIDIHNKCWSVEKNNSGRYIVTINLFNGSAEEYFQNIVDKYIDLIEKEKVKNAKKKDFDENKTTTYNERQLEIYQNILNFVQQKNSKLRFSVVSPSGSLKSTLDNILNYKQITEQLEKEKTVLKSNKDKYDEKEYKDLLSAKSKEIEECLQIVNTSKQGSGQLRFKQKDGKIYFSISHTFMSANNNTLNQNKILGVDLGIVNVATMQIFNTDTKDYDRLSYRECMIDGGELIAFRQQIFNRRRELQRATKTAGQGRRGHGTKTRLKPLLNLSDKESNFADTYNHKISKYIVEFALKHKCATIQMEDLSGFSGDKSDRFLKNWTYYKLQQYIKYKAEQYGIQVIFIDPKYTSKRCNRCGCIDEKNRDCKKDQSKFECVRCGHGKDSKVNADINAAKNIAMPDIEKAIKDELEMMYKLNKAV